MTYSNMITMDRTWTAIERTPRSRRSAIYAMFWVFARSGEFTFVQFFMAGNTKSKTITNFDYQFRIIGNWFNMMGMNFSTNLAAFLASVTISPINFVAPFCEIALCLCAFINQRFTALPRCCLFANHRFTTARSGTKTSAFISAIESLTTIGTLARIGWIAMRPAFFRTIFRIIRSVKLYFINSTTYLANLFDLSIFHNTIITPSYCAIQRWVDMTDGIPELIP